jgi:type II restriction enzyme
MTPHPAAQAIKAFWRLREEAAAKQRAAGKTDAGSRANVTAGQHMAELETLIIEELVAAGFARTSIRRKSGIELPGYYRPTKRWDVVVIDRSILVAAIEFKSQVGPSFANNVNNRSEEAIGNAVDVWRAYEAGTFGTTRPWLGYFFLLEEAPKSTRPIKLPKTVFPVDTVFEKSSYKDRYRVLCQRLVRERLYDAACYLTATRDAALPISEPDPELSFHNFAAAIAGRASYIHALPTPTSSQTQAS